MALLFPTGAPEAGAGIKPYPSGYWNTIVFRCRAAARDASPPPLPTANRAHRPIAQTLAVNRLETFEATHGRSDGSKSAAMVQLQGSA